MRGPIDYIVVGFPGNNFRGAILKELEKVSKNGTIKVLDVALVTKDRYGNVALVELTEPDLAKALDSLEVQDGLIDEDDVREIGELLENGTSAGLLIIEQLWAKGLKKAILDSDGVLISEGRIHPDASKELDRKGGK